MHQQRDADSDHDWWGVIATTKKANTGSFFKLRKLGSRRLLVGERRHIIWDTEENPDSNSCRVGNTERKEKASPLNEFALQCMVGFVKQIPKAVGLSTRKEIVINRSLIWNKTCISLSTCYGSPITRGKRKKKRLYKISSKWTHNWSILKFVLFYSYWRKWKTNYGRKE